MTCTTEKRWKIRDLSKESLGNLVKIKGWVRTLRRQKSFAFVEVNDGSRLGNIQVILENKVPENLSTGASIEVTGILVESPGKGQQLEIQAKTLEVLGVCPEDYPLQKKRHSFEFLRTIAHLRPRTNTIGAISRIRNCLAFATHRFFQNRGFLYLNSPIITASDCEGAGELFRVTTLDMKKPPLNAAGNVDFSKDFFGKPAFLTVSGQLNGEIFASGLSDVYTFGPTFRAENSNTTRHLAEFWMIEPEMAFCDLQGDMDVAESYLQFLIDAVLEECQEDLDLFDRFVSKGIRGRLEALQGKPYVRMSYTEAVKILSKSGHSFEYPVSWGIDLQSEHERFLSEEHVKGPVILHDYPKEIKAFYMRANNDEKTVAAMDVLMPGVGEIIGGSQREERYDVLFKRIEESNLDPQDYWWYLELRKYGSVPHAGFGLGFERLVRFVTGMENIREAIPFPRTPGHADF